MKHREPFTAEELAEASRYEIVINWSEEDQIYIAAHWIYGTRQQGLSVPPPRVLATAR